MSDIRFAEMKDKDRLCSLIQTVVGDENCKDVTMQIVNDLFENEHYKTFALEVQNRVEGVGVVKLKSFEGADDVAEIVWLAVDCKHRRSGFGKQLVHFMEDFSLGQQIRKVYVKVNTKNKLAVCFWIMQGYSFEARLLDFGSKGWDYYLLGKEIFLDEIGVSN